MWQPIETAPKDGTRVLLFRKGLAEDRAVCWWSNDFQVWAPVAGFTFPGATHWMPIPDPPVHDS